MHDEDETDSLKVELFRAGQHGDIAKIKLLLKQGIAAGWDVREDGTLLMRATAEVSVELVAELLASGANPRIPDRNGWNPLAEACLLGHAKLVQLLINSGADVNQADTALGFTPLFVAAREDRAEVVRILLEAGADPAAQTFEGKRAFDVSSREIAEVIRAYQYRSTLERVSVENCEMSAKETIVPLEL